LNRTEFLNVNEHLSRGVFLQSERIITFQIPEKWFITNSGSNTWIVLDEVLKGGHKFIDAYFAAVSKATGIPAVTAERRLVDFFFKSRQGKLGVDIRQVK